MDTPARTAAQNRPPSVISLGTGWTETDTLTDQGKKSHEMMNAYCHVPGKRGLRQKPPPKHIGHEVHPLVTVPMLPPAAIVDNTEPRC